MWIYFIEQVWCYDPDEWCKLGDTTHECQSRVWDYRELHTFPDGTPAYKTMVAYPQAHMVEGEDYIDF